MRTFRHLSLLLFTVTAIAATGCTGLRSIYSLKNIQAVATVPQPFVSSTAMTWVQTSPTTSAPVTATWTKSIELTLSNQKIQFYSDASCSTLQGALIDLASSALQTRSFTPPSDGTYTYKITSINAAAQTSVSNCSSPMVFDTTAPANASALTWVQSSPYNANAVTASWTKSISSDLASQKIQFYSDATCTVTSGSLTSVSPATGQTAAVTLPGDGSYTYKITSTDAAGNSATSGCSGVMVIDSVAPTNATALSWTETSPYNLTAVHASWTQSVATDLASQNIQYYADATCTSASGSLVSLTSAAQTHALTAPAEGSYTYKITSIDTAGNSATSGCSAVMVIDTTAPTNATLLSWTETSPHSGNSVNASWTKSVSTDLASQKIQYYADTTCTSTQGSLISLTAAAQTNAFTAPGDGSYTYKITSIDTAGNTSTTACSGVMVIDSTAPAAATSLSWTETSPHVGNSVNASWTKSVATDLSGQKIQFYADGTCSTTSGSLTTISPATAQTYAWTAPGSGTFSYKLTSLDAAGNSTASGCSSAMVIGSPTLAWTQSTFDFSNRDTLSVSESIFMVLNNSGSAAATGCSAPTLTNSTDFEMSIDNCGTADLATGTSCTVAVRAKPQTSGAKTTTIARVCTVGGTVTGTASGITVTGTAPSGHLAVSEGDTAFNAVSLTKNSATYDMFFLNNGTGDLSGCGSPYIDDTTNFSIVSENCGTGTMSANSSCKVTLNAHPTTAASKQTTLYRDCTGASTQTYSNGLTSTGYAQSNPTQIVSAYNWACTILANGKIRCWGDAGGTGVGDGNTNAAILPVTVANISTASKIALGRHHACAILSNQTVQCWGENNRGQIGDNTHTDRTVPVAVSGITTAVSIAAGEEFTCVVLANNTMKCWGNNDNGQLGTNSLVEKKTPTSVTGITTATDVVAMEQATCALLSNNTVKCWGIGNAGQLGNNAWASSSVPVLVSGVTTATKISAGGSNACVILSNNTVNCWGNGGNGSLGNGVLINSNVPVAVTGITTASALAVGHDHTCVLLSDNTARCWGDNGYGFLGDLQSDQVSTPISIAGFTGLTALSSGLRGSCGIKTDNTIICFGTDMGGDGYYGNYPSSRDPVSVLDITTATSIKLGNNHTCVLLSDATMRCWGANQGKLGNGQNHSRSRPIDPGLTGVSEISLGGDHTCARISGAIKCWGSNDEGRVGNGTTGTVFTPASVTGITTATQIAAGGGHTCALLSDQTVKCWGGNSQGSLGDGTNTDSTTPVSVSGITNAVEIKAGDEFACARLSTGVVKCWGKNDYGQVGDGTTTNRNTPVVVAGLTNATMLALGTSHACAILSDQSMRCWGSNDQNQLGNPASASPSLSPQPVLGMSNAVKIVALENTVCLRDSNSIGRCFGMSQNSQAGDRTRSYPDHPITVLGLGTILDIGIGYQMACAIVTGGSVKCWGGSGDTEGMGWISYDTPYIKTVSGF